MRILVTGSSGHLGEALMRLAPTHGHAAIGLDAAPGPFTDRIGSIQDCAPVAEAMAGADAVIHAATLHKPHVVTNSMRDFIEVNVTGTLILLEEAVRAGVRAFVFTSSTSAFGAALSPSAGAPAAWIDETVAALPKNIYGVTKTAAEDLCALFHRRYGLACVILRTSRFFPEIDDDPAKRALYPDANLKANEFLFRRVDLEDAAAAHFAAAERASELGFERLVISATTPFATSDRVALAADAPTVVRGLFPEYPRIYAACGFQMFPTIERVYDNGRARRALDWRPRHDFATILGQLDRGEPIGSALARAVGAKGYHTETFADGPYPVEPASA